MCYNVGKHRTRGHHERTGGDVMADISHLKENPIFFSRLGAEWYPSLYTPDGKPYYGYTDAEIKTLQRYHRDFAAAGVHTHSIILDCGWKGIDCYDYTVTDLQLAHLFEADPDGYVLPRIKMDPPLDWCRTYPEEVFLYANGKGLTREQISALVGTPSQAFWQYKVPEWYEKYEDFKKGAPLKIDCQSLSSVRWHADAALALQNLIRHLEGGPFADRIVGYHPAFGHAGECMQWRIEDYRNHGDYGIANLQRFYDFGLAKYGTREALAKAWQQPDITRDTVQLPSPEERYGEGNTLQSYFRGRDKDVIARDFDIFLSDSTATAILALAKAARACTEKPVGFFYGYFLFAADIQYEGHLALSRVLASPDVDFLASPTAYHFRAGNSPSLEMVPPQSVNREKLYLEEIDTRTYIVPLDKAGVKPRDCTRSFPETRYVLWRSLCKNLSHGSAFWWMDIGRGWFDAPDIMAEFKALTKAHGTLKKGEHKSVADVLVVMEETCLASTQNNRLLTHSFVRDLVLTTRSAGVLCDLYRTEDLDKLDLSRYRLVVFGTNYTLTRAQLAQWHFREDATLMFYGTVGILGNGTPTLANVEALTGFALEEDFDEALQCPIARIKNEENDLLAKKQVGERAHVLCTDPRLTPATFRRICRDAGCHVYTDTDCILFGDSDFLSVFAKGETSTVLHFDGKRQGSELLSGKAFCTADLPLSLREHEFMIFQYDAN